MLGPYNDLLLCVINSSNSNPQEYCSTALATTHNKKITKLAGEFYVVMVSNWAATGSTPVPCF